jgi:23S rRNA (cytosine1962-C5)-methyltransferase
MWAPALDEWSPDATFVPGSDEEGGGRWVQHRAGAASWPLARDGVRFHASLTPFRHLGFFPDMAPQWDWMRERADGRRGAQPVRLHRGRDAAAERSGRQAGPCRRVEEVGRGRPGQCRAVGHGRPADPLDRRRRRQVHRARGAARRRYDGILLDPPKFGRGPEGEVWRLEEHLAPLLADCRKLLDADSRFLVLTVYAVRMSALSDRRIAAAVTADLGGTVECGEMAVREEARGLLLPTAIFARWSKTSSAPPGSPRR